MINHAKTFTDDYLIANFDSLEIGKYHLNKYLQSVNETIEQAIYRLNKYCIVPWNSNQFDYFDDFLVDFFENQETKYTTINTGGSRLSAKTYNIIDFSIKLIKLAMKKDSKIGIYGFRLFGADILELKKEFFLALERHNFKQSDSNKNFKNGQFIYSGQNGIPYFRFIDGSFIYLKGLYKANDRTITLKGLATANNLSKAIVFFEEANEFTKDDFVAATLAIRGVKDVLVFKASNPDEIYQHYVFEIDKNLKFNEFELRAKGYQFKKTYDPKTMKGEIFHIVNYQTNPYLTKKDVVDMLELKKRDPYKYRIWGIGMPGGLDTAVFAPYMKQHPLDFKPTSFSCGIDLGWSSSSAGHPTAGVFVGFDLEGMPRAHCLSEYYHSNATMNLKQPTQIVEEIIDWLVNVGKKYPLVKRKTLRVMVDVGGGGLPTTDMLNQQTRKRFDLETNQSLASWLTFEVTKKDIYLIKDRIEIDIWLLSRNILSMNENDTPWLYKTMKMIQYKKQKPNIVNTTPQMLDLNDDCWDAKMYAIMPQISSLLKDWKENRLYNREFAKINHRLDLDPNQLNW